MSSRFDLTKCHKPLCVVIFGGGTLALLALCILFASRGSTGLAVGFGIAFVLAAVPVGLWFVDMFVWEPRRNQSGATTRLQELTKHERHRQDRMRQRAQGMRG